MTVDNKLVNCSECGLALKENPSLPVDDRIPCPNCGSTKRDRHIIIHDKIIIKEKLRMKGKEPGVGRPFIEVVSGDDLHRKTGKWMDLRRKIDRRNNLYHEVVTNPETGEIVHECK